MAISPAGQGVFLNARAVSSSTPTLHIHRTAPLGRGRVGVCGAEDRMCAMRAVDPAGAAPRRRPDRRRRTPDEAVLMNPGGGSAQSRVLLELCRRFVRPALRVAPLTGAGVRSAFLIEMLAGLRR